MPIPNVSTLYQRIAKGSEGGHEFARFMRLLLMREYNSDEGNFISESDASGDYKKVDGYIKGDADFPKNIIGFQFKFFPSNLSSDQRREIKRSVEAAINENEFIQELIILTPEDFQANQQKWLEELARNYEKNYWLENDDISRKCHFKLLHWGHSKIIELSLRHDDIGVHYFPELFPHGAGKFKLAMITVAQNLCCWQSSTRDHVYTLEARKDLTTDIILDIQFKNSTNEIHLLQRVDVHIERVWTTLKGIPTSEFLASIGLLEFKIDFTKRVNELQLSDPLIFDPQKAKRFQLQLCDILKCPGNWLQLKIWFYFDDVTLVTPSLFFSL